jgi:isopenicillin N synthase-like dioxygenase
MPCEDKMKIEVNAFHRGFIPINTSTVKTSTVAKVARPNQSESFMMMHDLPDDDSGVLAGAPLAGPNQWPERLRGIGMVMTATADFPFLFRVFQ